VNTMKLYSQQLAALPRTSTVLKSPVAGSYRASCSAAVELMLSPHTSQALAAEGGFQSALYSPSAQAEVTPFSVLKPGGVTVM
jgi:hypothetical protein